MSHRALLSGLAALATLSLLFALATGSVYISPTHVWAALSGAVPDGGAGVEWTVVRELRLPRAVAAFATGGMLALAGALMQVLLRNPLADPYVLGISGGAAVAALLVLLLGLGGAWVSLGAFGGALCSMFLVFGLAHARGSWTPTRLLLTGVVIAAGWGALISLLLALSPQSNLRGMLFWLMGDLGQAQTPGAALFVLVLGMIASLPIARSLNVLAHGDLQAGALGVAVAPLRLAIYVLASLLTAGAVAVAGSVGFVGLITPHLLRLVSGSDHRILLPASVLLGGSLLVLADTAARTVFAPQELPVGVVTALIGVPLFLYLLQRRA